MKVGTELDFGEGMLKARCTEELEHGGRVMELHFDTEKLETKQYQQLKEGVRIQDKAHFQKVIDMLRAMQKEES